ncbi:MAG: alpha/beta fold hydrolase [Gammaproteobacteria bacterium]|nr:alpha/beta fold hydrolase [Gammaproteobacteria bacterium]
MLICLHSITGACKRLTKLGVLVAFISTGFLVNSVAHAEIITLNHQHKQINARLSRAGDKALSQGVVLILHGALAHYDMELIRQIQQLLQQSEQHSLAINLSLGIDKRQGMFDCQQAHYHRNQDAIEELGVWIRWLEQQNVDTIHLLGHSRGGAQIALFAANYPPASIKSIVLLAPATAVNTSEADYKKRHQQELGLLLREAHVLSQQQPMALINNAGILFCTKTSVSAQTLLSYYTDPHLMDSVFLLNRITLPSLVVIAGDDEIVPDLGDRLATLSNRPHIQAYTVDSASHFFRDLNGEEAVERIVEFFHALKN